MDVITNFNAKLKVTLKSYLAKGIVIKENSVIAGLMKIMLEVIENFTRKESIHIGLLAVITYETREIANIFQKFIVYIFVA